MKTLPRSLAVLAAAVVLASCSTMHGMMGGSGAVTLTGANEVPANDSKAEGTGTVKIGEDHSVTADITVTGMTATAAHIHQGAKGANGPVVVPFTKAGDNHFVSAPGAKLTDAQYEAYKAGNLYVNVHSAAHPGGEVRAQLAP